MGQETSLAVDIGGTFTDVVLRRGGEVFVDKVLTTPANLLDGFFGGIDSVLAHSGVAAAEVDVLVHATTVVTNALIERRGARTAMVFTKGFGDILEIRDERRYDMYDPQIEFPRPLVGPADVFTIAERVNADGEIEREIDADEAARLADTLRQRGVQSIGICFLHSYKNAGNERRLGALLRDALPDLYISLSSDVAPQIREFLRASTTAANAYAVPITQPYLSGVETRLVEQGFPSRALIMLSSGGVVGPGTAGRMPIRMVESGPAAGALGAAFIAQELGLRDVLAFDMGGTTAKVCLIQDYKPLVTGQFEIDRMYRFKEGSGLPVTVPCIDLIEIGAGGGSIAHVDSMGLLKVGPRSAGSNPGPACYGFGGRNATVTDADLVLGLLDAQHFLGGDMPLDEAAAFSAVGQIAADVDLGTIEAARGIYQVVCEAMAGAVRTHATERGVDYRGIPLLAFGGAGPVHACGVARLLNSRTVIFPPLASVLSAFGSLATPTRLDLVRSSLSGLEAMDWPQVDALFDEMEREGRQALREAGAPDAAVTFAYAADMRYLGQHYELLVSFDRRPSATNAPQTLRAAFEAEYLKRYSLIQSDVPVEVVTWRIAAIGPGATPPTFETASGKAAAPIRRKVHAWANDQMVPVMPRAALQNGKAMAGPLIIEERETTLVIPPGWTATLGPLGCVTATYSDELDA
ncbi:N-methylhydantoinase A [Rhodoligotrophos appendicifer]|uniref:hydantoinase/oxoprolinase family protein n=1 Tax=Rhodoligotrophos appendicifer TaxID=987056 RepID=UPI0011853DFF|nr:hydantoinase/oxoprolinase family protein [Rhodoligotrophos appendicifer]